MDETNVLVYLKRKYTKLMEEILFSQIFNKSENMNNFD